MQEDVILLFYFRVVVLFFDRLCRFNFFLVDARDTISLRERSVLGCVDFN